MDVALTRDVSGRLTGNPSILLASDTERLGSSLHRVLEEQGFEVAYAGNYSAIQRVLSRQNFDVILLEVTGEYAVEDAVAAALRVKRNNGEQFVGYVADAGLEASGLAGDGIFPRSGSRLGEVLRNLFTETAIEQKQAADGSRS